ncbi:bifunctional diaminohydroxyphosphoribosylaminopyrimidine deaminase/5-amino-6-(5-phosphoribosylamino)uracil reductase RibD [Mailhella sp.]|uniref:bifunctional diaminohydroxyphosphoribosylaminopyrimidine deaminase/5-amino-6-(5-phosphoribosylamino)uracil reductase RibD n=1 Tax=Mailhella sp. TaxID=1981029 RepID=UPI0040638E7F
MRPEELAVHERFMRRALELAERGRWSTAPNPTVGAVLVKDGAVAAEGWHQVCGQAHAEVNCLRDAAAKGVDPAGGTLYVTLEPCNHFGRTPPCSHAVLEAGIGRVVIGMLDPNAKAAGGAEFLRENGVDVVSGVLEDECRDLVADFLVWQTTRRPYVILKMASTLDGRISTQGGSGQKITNDASHAEVQRLREGIGRAGGAILVGGNTFALDDPRLTARTPSAQRQPLAAVLTTRLPSGSGSAILRERPSDAVFFTSAAQAASPTAEALRGKGARVYEVKVQGVPGREGQAVRARLNAAQALEMLRAEEGCLYVLCEGGGKLALSLLEEGLVDELHLHLAPVILGDASATPVFAGRSAESMAEALRMRVTHTSLVDGDIHLHFRADRG